MSRDGMGFWARRGRTDRSRALDRGLARLVVGVRRPGGGQCACPGGKYRDDVVHPDHGAWRPDGGSMERADADNAVGDRRVAGRHVDRGGVHQDVGSSTDALAGPAIYGVRAAGHSGCDINRAVRRYREVHEHEMASEGDLEPPEGACLACAATDPMASQQASDGLHRRRVGADGARLRSADRRDHCHSRRGWVQYRCWAVECAVPWKSGAVNEGGRMSCRLPGEDNGIARRQR